MDRMVSIRVCSFLISHGQLQKQNFLRDQSGMKKQLATLQQLIAVMDPELYKHFGKVTPFEVGNNVSDHDSIEKTESLNLFFCFR